MMVFFTGTVAIEGNIYPINNALLGIFVLGSRFVFPKIRFSISTQDKCPRGKYEH